MSNVAHTSIASLRAHTATGATATQAEAILKFLRRCKTPKTRRQISERTGIEYTAVCGRVNTLVNTGRVSEVGVTLASTQRQAKLVQIN